MSECGKTAFGAGVLLAVLGVCIALAAVGGWEAGRRQAIAFAAAVAGGGAVGGWLVGRMGRGASPGIAVASSLAAGLVRLLPPLGGLAWVTTSEGAWKSQGSAGLLVAFYLALLAADVLLQLALNGKRRPSRGADGGI